MAMLTLRRSTWSLFVLTVAFAIPLTALAASGAQTPTAGATPPAKSTGGSSVASRSHATRDAREAIQAQEALNNEGATLRVDGKLGPQTRTAISTFQRTHNLSVTGKLDELTEAALKIRS